MIDGYLAKAAPPPLDNVVALVAPHAGYIYSGPVAAYSYALLKGRKFDRVVIVAPSHYEGIGFSSVYDGAAYETPFGQVPVDQDFARKLAKASPSIRLSSAGHKPTADHPEHSIEVQLPFLQRVLGQFAAGARSSWEIKATTPAAPSAWRWPKLVGGDQHADRGQLRPVPLSHLRRGGRDSTIRRCEAIEEYDYFDLARNLDTAGLGSVRRRAGGGHHDRRRAAGSHRCQAAPLRQ
jgi:hypothetical protein